ncbi:Basic amino-acid permease [Orbilia brochopaga]|uniref:Basic amino-acid permease n=1 Tax=Orbilia brochopaga TaxID=3140254 RepID=A0AAV9V402_9PEZI
MKISSTFKVLAAVLPFVNFAGIAAALPLDVPTTELPSAQAPGPKKVIVVLKDQVDSKKLLRETSWVRLVHARNLQKRQATNTTTHLPTGVEGTYDINKFKAYAGSFDEETIAEIQSSDNVEYIEEEQEIYITGVQSQYSAPWGLAQLSSRVSSRKPFAKIEDPHVYQYDASAGEGMYVYVLDTGILTAHKEFEGRAEHGFTAVEDADDADHQGHGTHVAGIIAGKTWGVAKKARVISVKVLDDRTSNTAVALDGFNWAVQDIIEKKRQNIAVINMSLGSNFSRALNEAVENAYAEGIISVCSAGNFAGQASDQSPASAKTSITVGAINVDGTRLPQSNFGDAVTLWAPGSRILSASNASVEASIGFSGTSQAAPHVAGLICYLRALEGLKGTDVVRQRLLDMGQKNVLKTSTLMGSANILAYNGADSEETALASLEQSILHRGWKWVKGSFEDVKTLVLKLAN